ncbi:MAG: lysoplasmalogenase [Roseivirga sp.]
MNTPKHLLPYLFIGLLNLIACAFGQSDIQMFTKPLLMPALAFYFYQSVPATPLNRFVMAALFFSFLGDTLLMFSDYNSLFFTIGLATFLLAHLVYIIINMNAVEEAGKGFRLQWQDIPFILFGLIIFSIVKKDLGEMYFPALGYTVIICIMTMTARKRWKRTDMNSFWLVMSGAIFFLVSDSLLAINKFMEPIPQADLLVMSTYLIAQFLIIRGLIVFIKKIRQEAGS